MTPRSWFYKFPFGSCCDGSLCLKPALQQDGDDVGSSASSCLGPLLFLVWLIFLFCFDFSTITNTKDPIEKTFCFTGNKKIIYASVKCKRITSPSSSSQTRSLWSLQKPTETHRWLLYFYTPLRWEEWKDSPNRQNPIALYHVSGVDE